MRLILSLCLSFFLFSAEAEAANPRVQLDTNMGTIILELYPEKAPISVENFIQYVEEGFYNGVIFHRVIPGFMIQTGGFNEMMSQKTTRPTIKNEADNGLQNQKYTIAMARTNAPHSASSQFFISVANNPSLNHKRATLDGWGYAVFGKVIEGFAVVDKIAKVPTGNLGQHGDVPETPVIINSAKVLK